MKYRIFLLLTKYLSSHKEMTERGIKEENQSLIRFRAVLLPVGRELILPGECQNWRERTNEQEAISISIS
jgi:hypothetical protein